MPTLRHTSNLIKGILLLHFIARVLFDYDYVSLHFTHFIRSIRPTLFFVHLCAFMFHAM